jgi:uncharacterized membrane protein HdeD (DUF308 family)
VYRPATATSVLIGILSIIIGIMALAWPGVTVLAIVLLFAIYAQTPMLLCLLCARLRR